MQEGGGAVGTRRSLLALVLAGLLAAGCAGGGTGAPKADAPRTPATTGTPVDTHAPGGGSSTLVAAGDIANCGTNGDEQTAALLDRLPGTVLTLGDTVYEDGSTGDFAKCYAPSWGRFRDRTYPVPGNHDYHTPGASSYFDFFGSRAGPRGKGWYSFDLGGWHLIGLNSNCGDVGGCAAGSEQERWLRADLAAHPARCTLAFWHHPRFSSGTRHGSRKAVGALWTALHDAGADLVLSAHEHNYERFAPLDSQGRVDPARGIREFVVGTGGDGHYPFGTPLPGSEARNSDTYGVLQLQLQPTGYRWRFVPTQEGSFEDSGSGTCH
jgi:Calcineurin-like phosphoesterase